MIISSGRRYIFVHIPKTGGTALAMALEARAMRDDLLIGDTPKARRRRGRLKGLEAAGRLWKHSTLADIDGLIRQQELASFFIFALVRNPWDRAVSYYHWLRAQSFEHHAVAVAKSRSFGDFCRDAGIQRSFANSPAASYVTDTRGQERCSAFIRIEQFEKDAAPIWRHLGFELTLPRVNVSDRERDYRGYFDDETRQIVGTCCRADVERFGYRFDPEE